MTYFFGFKYSKKIIFYNDHCYIAKLYLLCYILKKHYRDHRPGITNNKKIAKSKKQIKAKTHTIKGEGNTRNTRTRKQ